MTVDNSEIGVDDGSGGDKAVVSVIAADSMAVTHTWSVSPSWERYLLPVEGAIASVVPHDNDAALLWVTTDTGAVYVVDTAKTPPTCDRVA